MAHNAGDQPSTSAASLTDTVKQEQIELQLSLTRRLNAIIEAYESQTVQLSNACQQTDEIIVGELCLSEFQQGLLHEQYVTNLKEVAARWVFVIR